MASTPEQKIQLPARTADGIPAGDAGTERGVNYCLPDLLPEAMLLTGIALGLREALEPKRDEAAIMVEAPGEPPGDKALEVNVDSTRPAESVMVIRPWLLREEP